ncbi:hypothetical protein CSC94_23495 [Zhengella mangrovi]|uniref:HTH-like domain-containing protein n=1 Tax=Zhengella mangrovi TaxID=1982044 RepID=A0A2G1QGF3_9HYPH|nr:hypothetical protein CSC94_23495 [Zhengella mangrovi]
MEAARLLLQGRGCGALPIIRRLVDQRPTYGYRRITALLNRVRRAAHQPVVNAKRVHGLLPVSWTVGLGLHSSGLECHGA